MLIYMMNFSEQVLSIYEVLIHKLEQCLEAFDPLSTGYLPMTLPVPTQLTHMLKQVKTALQRINPYYKLLFLCYIL